MKNFKKLFSVGIITLSIFSFFSYNSSYAMNNENNKCEDGSCTRLEKTMFFVAKNSGAVCRSVRNFFSTKTNRFLQPTKKIIPTTDEIFKRITKKSKILKESGKKIVKLIKNLNTLDTDIKTTEQIPTLEHVNNCISNYEKNIEKNISYMNDHSKILEQVVTTTKEPGFFGKIFNSAGKTVKNLVKSKTYDFHNGISKNGIKDARSMDYSYNLLKNDKQNLENFNQCLKRAPNKENILDSKWYKTLVKAINKDKKIVNKRAFLIWLEKIKYHSREILETLCPENKYVKWALITGGTVFLSKILFNLIFSKIYRLGRNRAPARNRQGKFKKTVVGTLRLLTHGGTVCAGAVVAVLYKLYQEGFNPIA